MTIVDNKIDLNWVLENFNFFFSKLRWKHLHKHIQQYCQILLGNRTFYCYIMSISSNISPHVNELPWTAPWHGSVDSRSSPTLNRQFIFILTTLNISRASQHGCQLFYSFELWVKEQPWAAALLIALLSSSKINSETGAPQRAVSPITWAPVWSVSVLLRCPFLLYLYLH